MSNPKSPTLGSACSRREDDLLVTGQGNFVDDIELADVLFVSFQRSSSAYGRIAECDTSQAREKAGVVAVFTGADVSGLGELSINGVLDEAVSFEYPVLAHRQVLGVGQPVVAIVGTDRKISEDALEEIFVNIDDSDCSKLDRCAGEKTWSAGDVDDAFSSADHVVEVSIEHPRLAPSPMEPRSIAVEYCAFADKVTVYNSTQTPHRARSELARILDVDASRIRVIAPDVGGAFGMKASLYPEEVFCVWAAFKLRRSVRWTASRSEEFLSATHGRGASSTGQLAVSSQGVFLGLRATMSNPLGYWLPHSALIPAWNAGRIIPSGYKIDNVKIDTKAQLSNTSPVGIYRGAGRPEAICLIERLIDKAAHVGNFDPVKLRLDNLISPDEQPHRTATGCLLDSGDYGAALGRLCDQGQYKNLVAMRDERQKLGELVGVGVAFYVEPCGKGWESARVELACDGSVLVSSGSSSQGHGRETAYAQIAADHLSVDSELVTVICGDTELCPPGIGALASRSTAIGGSAVAKACRLALQKRQQGEQLPIQADVVYETEGEAWGYGCYLVVVSIDRDTGKLTIEDAICVDDAGSIINPALVNGQISGGFAQGLGEAMMEQIIYDEDGQLITGSFTDYAMPLAADIPPLRIIKIATPSPFNILGAKGIGEAGTIGAPPAILNAAIDALRPLGIEDLQLPLTSQQLWLAIQSNDKGSK